MPAPVHARRTKGLERSLRARGRAASPPYDVQRTEPHDPPAWLHPIGCGGHGAGEGFPFETAGSNTQATTGRPASLPAGLVGLGRLERPTSRLSGVRSNQLSYRPESHPHGSRRHPCPPTADTRQPGYPHPPTADAGRPRPGLKTGRPGAIHRLCLKGRADGGGRLSVSDLAIRSGFRPAVKPAEVTFRKEVIQPQVPLRLPCYDFTPVADPTVDACLPYGLAQRLRVEPTPMV